MAEKKVEKAEEVKNDNAKVEARIPGDLLAEGPEGTEVEDAGSAWKRVDRTQGAYDDSALQKSLEDLGRSEAARVEDEKPV